MLLSVVASLACFYTSAWAKANQLALRRAISRGDLAKVQSMIKDNPGLVSNKDFLGRTPLYDAVRVGRKEVVELLLANHADINARDDRGLTPLHDAADSDYKEGVKWLLANHADLDARDNAGGTPLHHAAKAGHAEVVNLLLGSHADVNARDNAGWTPLHYAADQDHKEVVELLLANHADVNAKANSGDTPLHRASLEGHSKDVVDVLLANGANPNASNVLGDTPANRLRELAEEADRQQKLASMEKTQVLVIDHAHAPAPLSTPATLRNMGGAALALAHAFPGGLPTVYLDSIDGKDPSGFGLKNLHCFATGKGQPKHCTFGEKFDVSLTPGRHVLMVGFHQIGYNNTFIHSGAPTSVEFTAEPGHIYEVGARVDNGKIGYFVADFSDKSKPYKVPVE
jgi:ankyrin repeat protein